MRVLSIDPGKDNGGTKSASGWCYQDEEKILTHDSRQLWGNTKNLAEFLLEWDIKEFPVDQVVVEGYYIQTRQQGKMYGNMGKGRLATSENVGKVKFWAAMHKIPVHEFFNTDKITEQNVTGFKIDKSIPKELTHRIDAYNHGRYYLVTVSRTAPSYLEQILAKEGKL